MNSLHHFVNEFLRISLTEPLRCVKADTCVPLMVILTGRKRAALILLSVFTIFLILFPFLLLAAPFIFVGFCVSLLLSPPSKPEILGGDQHFIQHFLDTCPSLREVYQPPSIWGRSGLLQTLVIGTAGRFSWRLPEWERRSHVVSDGATIYYDVAQPKGTNNTGKDVTLFLVPGFTNFSDIHYMRYFCRKAQKSGYRCVVFNHVGMIPGSKLTAPRIYNFGNTSDMSTIVDLTIRENRGTKMIILGYSLGGSIVTKYAGERGDNLSPSICGIVTIGQAFRFQDLSRYRNPIQLGVMLIVAEVFKGYLFNNRASILTDELKEKFDLDEEKIKSAYSLQDIDELYTRRILGKSSTEELYREFNAESHLHKVRRPLVIFIAADDPSLPYAIQTAKPLVENRKDTIMIVTRHGGHLAYYKGGTILPKQDSWIDGAILETVHALANKSHQS